MAARARSAALTAGVHAAALVLAMAGWHSAAPLPAPRGIALVHMPMAAPAHKPASSSPRPVDRAKPEAKVPQTSQPDPPALPPPRPAIVPAPTASALAANADQPSPPLAATGHAERAEPAAESAGAGNPPAQAAPGAQRPPAPAGQAGPSNSYAQQVFRHIQRFKEFPAHLARTGMAGRVLVRFAIAPGGEAAGIAIVRSSGEPALDALALAQIRAASPFPRPPRQLEAALVQFVVPMTYRPAS